MARLGSTTTALATAAAVSAVIYGIAGQPVRESAAATSPGPTDVVAYELRTPGSAETCVIARGADRGAGLAGVTPDANCARLLPRLGEAAFWEERQDGSIALSGEDRDPIVTFAVADGVGYESYWPQVPLLSLAEKR